MQIVWNKDYIEDIKNHQIVLELETIKVQDQDLTAWCVVPFEKIGLENLTTLETYRKLHDSFVSGLKEKDYKLCQEIAPHLQGKFGGELDSFYEEILKRIALEQESSTS